MTSDTTQDLPGYCPVAGEIAIHEDNYGLQLARYLAQKEQRTTGAMHTTTSGMIVSTKELRFFQKSLLKLQACSFQKRWSIGLSYAEDAFLPNRCRRKENLRCQRAFFVAQDGFLDEWENAEEALAAQEKVW